MADAEGFLEFLEGGVGMFVDVGLKFFGVELTPMSPTLFRGQRAGFSGDQIPINGTPRQIKTPGGLGFGTPALNEFHHPFPQVQCIRFHASKAITLCPNVNMKYYNVKKMTTNRIRITSVLVNRFCASIPDMQTGKLLSLLAVETEAIEGIGSGHLDGQQVLVANREWLCSDGNPIGR